MLIKVGQYPLGETNHVKRPLGGMKQVTVYTAGSVHCSGIPMLCLLDENTLYIYFQADGYSESYRVSLFCHLKLTLTNNMSSSREVSKGVYCN